MQGQGAGDRVQGTVQGQGAGTGAGDRCRGQGRGQGAGTGCRGAGTHSRSYCNNASLLKMKAPAGNDKLNKELEMDNTVVTASMNYLAF